MTLVEFIAALAKPANREKVLAVLYFRSRYDKQDSLTVEQIRAALRAARIVGWKKMNIADVLAKCGPFVDSPASAGTRRLWQLTKSGEAHIRTRLGVPDPEPEIEHDASSLQAIAAKLKDEDIRGYVEESVKCLRAGALRAAIVFLWTGAVRLLQTSALAIGPTAVTDAIQRHDRKCRRVSTPDHFAYVKDKDFLLAAQDLGILDKGQKATLQEALDLRNRCGHPSKYKPGIKKASSFVEDVVGIVFK